MFRLAGRLLASTALALLLLWILAVCGLRALLDRIGVSSPRAGKPSSGERLRILTIGTFYHPNWYRAHLGPLSSAAVVEELRVVSGSAGEPMERVRWCVAPAWMVRLFGRNLSRLLVAALEAWRWRPQIIIGYFIFPSALMALLLARLTGALAGYQMCGGPYEVLRCGFHSENPFLTKVLPRFPGLERLLLCVVGQFDVIVVRGASARRFCQEHFPGAAAAVLTAGIDGARFRPTPGSPKRFDVVTVSRLSSGKRVDVLVRALALLSRDLPGVTGLIVGDGPERDGLERLCSQLAMNGRIHFASTRDDVETVLHQSRLFVLPSDSEGLSIAMVEAMACGLPAVVSNVGELGDLVRNGRNGYLVPRGDEAAFASAIGLLLKEAALREAMGAEAAENAHALCSAAEVSARWDRVLRELMDGRRSRASTSQPAAPSADRINI